MTNEKPNPFNIIKYRGEPDKAEFEGVTVTRQKEIYADEWGMVPCMPYDNHFIFEIPKSRKKTWSGEHLCTCGSPAVIKIPENIWVCLFHHSRLYETGHGYHQTAVINKGDFENIAGETIELPEKGKKWLI